MGYQPDMLSAVFKMVASLASALALLFLIFYIVRKLSAGKTALGNEKLITILESRYLGVKKTISLVEVAGSIMVLGIAGDRISLLDKIDPDQIKNRDLFSDKTEEKRGFKEQLKSITKNIKPKN